MINWWKVNLQEEELEAVRQAISGRHISHGSLAGEFEKELARFLNVPYVVLAPNGSCALFMALIASGIKAGDEVIVPNRTFVATANSVLLLGAKVKLVDVQSTCSVIDAAKVEEAITDKTRAIMPVHLNGRGVDMAAISALAKKHRLKIIVDAAQALASRDAGICLGTQGDVGAFSLGVAKMITTGQGGAVATRAPGVYERLLKLRNHGAANMAAPEYEEFGFNFKFTDILAAIGLAQLRKLPRKVQRHTFIYEYYRDALQDLDWIRMIPVNLQGGEIPLWAEVLCKDRDKVTDQLDAQGIFCRRMAPSLSDLRYLRDSRPFPASALFAREGMILPCGPDQSDDDLRRVVEALRAMPRCGR